MPTINDDPQAIYQGTADPLLRVTDDGVHRAELVGSVYAWSLVLSVAPPSGGGAGVFYADRTDPTLAVVPTPAEIGESAFEEGMVVYVTLPNEATEAYVVDGTLTPVLEDTKIGPRRYETLPAIADYNSGESIEMYGQDDPDDDGVYTLQLIGGNKMWVQD